MVATTRWPHARQMRSAEPRAHGTTIVSPVVNDVDYGDGGALVGAQRTNRTIEGDNEEGGEANVTSSRAAGDRPRKRLARATLSRELIVEAAERVARRDGLDQLTFRSIGKEIGAHPTSVYRHFRDKDELVLELIDTLRARSYGGTLKSSGDWRNDLRHVAEVIRRHYLNYPEFALDMASRTTRRSTEFSNVEFALGALKRAGLDPAEAAICLRAYGNMIRSVAAMEASMQTLPPETRAADDLAWQVEYRALPDDEFPNIAEHRDQLTTLSDPRIFDTVVEMMLDAIELRARRSGDEHLD